MDHCLSFFSLFLSHCIVCISLSYYNNTNFFTRNLKVQQSSSIQPTTRTQAIPPEKQTTIIVNTINYKNTSHSPGKTNNNHRQYNQLQEHEPFPRKNKQQSSSIQSTTRTRAIPPEKQTIIIVNTINYKNTSHSHGKTNINLRQYNQLREHDLFPRKNKQQSSSIQSTTRTRAIPPEKQTTIIVNTTNYKNTSHSPGKTNNNRRQYNQLQQHEPFPRKNKQQSSSIQPTTRTRAIPPEKQTIIIVNTTNYKNTSHSPGKTNNNRRQYNQLQQHEPFPRKNKQ